MLEMRMGIKAVSRRRFSQWGFWAFILVVASAWFIVYDLQFLTLGLISGLRWISESKKSIIQIYTK